MLMHQYLGPTHMVIPGYLSVDFKCSWMYKKNPVAFNVLKRQLRTSSFFRLISSSLSAMFRFKSLMFVSSWATCVSK